MHRKVKCACVHAYRHVCITCASIVPGQQTHNNEAKMLSKIVAILGSSVTSQSCYKSYHYRQTLLCLLSIESLSSSSRSQEGRGGQKITPELLNETFSAKVTRPKSSNTISNPNISGRTKRLDQMFPIRTSRLLWPQQTCVAGGAAKQHTITGPQCRFVAFPVSFVASHR